MHAFADIGRVKNDRSAMPTQNQVCVPDGHASWSRVRSELVFQRGRLILGETKAERVGTWCCGGFPPAACVRTSNTHDIFGHVNLDPKPYVWTLNPMFGG